jgi:hypothetical protein
MSKAYRLKRQEFKFLTIGQVELITYITGNVSSNELTEAENRLTEKRHEVERLGRRLDEISAQLVEESNDLRALEIALLDECRATHEEIERNGQSIE